MMRGGAKRRGTFVRARGDVAPATVLGRDRRQINLEAYELSHRIAMRNVDTLLAQELESQGVEAQLVQSAAVTS